eukprot:10948494-Lingulodinium_polyedra.AAC.1
MLPLAPACLLDEGQPHAEQAGRLLHCLDLLQPGAARLGCQGGRTCGNVRKAVREIAAEVYLAGRNGRQ